MEHRVAPVTEEEAKIRALEHELLTLRSKHETLGGAYRGACQELERLREEIRGLKARVGAIQVLCEVAAP
jgi:hypothetical protein